VRIDIGDGVRLYVDVTGFGLVPVNGKMVKRPTLLLLHGGPGLDHATYKLGLHEMSDVAQVIVYDHRGHGRSDRRSPEEWNLDTWADDVVRLCDALYTQSAGNTFEMVESVGTPKLFAHWNAGEHHTMDLRADLGRAQCPVLVLAGELDPVCPMAGAEEIVASLPADLAQFERFEHSGHGVFRDEPERADAVLRTFIADTAAISRS